jgi:hypothetical protein
MGRKKRPGGPTSFLEAAGAGVVSSVEQDGTSLGETVTPEPQPSQPLPKIETPKPGIYLDVPFDNYAQWDAVNHGILNNFRKTPAHVLYELQHGGKARTPSLELGWLTHLATLEPDRFEREYVVAIHVDRRYTEGKRRWAEFTAAHEGKQFIEADDNEAVLAMRHSLCAHPTAGEFLGSKGGVEVSILWEDKETGVLCKARIDKIGAVGEWPLVGDIKTSADASRRAFERDLYNYGYGLQAAHYLDGLETLVPLPTTGQPFRRFGFFVVESSAPWAVAVYEPDDTTLAQAAMDRQRFLRKWKHCVETGHWPGYPDGIELVSYPAWAFKTYELESGD